MYKLLQIDFPFTGPFGEEMTAAFGELAATINDEPGFIWKVWTENRTTEEAGGIYLFDGQENAQAYLIKHTERLESFGISGIKARIFDVNEPLSLLNKATLAVAQ
ncbi:monooxygenase [Oceanobacter mangrovi]|uniref:monooxygenase n=1 Tax=Oceanobacter mangrovi TaxID=2862510 RepID=UPI001C8DD14A|nr:monooxygenase [Oceanobacter mangrovi]